MKFILKIALRQRKKLALIYFLLIVGEALHVCEPFILGKAVDGLLNVEYQYLGLLALIFLSYSFFTYKRMVYDTKTYTQINNDIIFSYLDKNPKASVSSKSARTDLSSNIVNFLEHDIHYYCYALITTFGSLYFVFILDHLTALFLMTSVFPISLIVFIFFAKIRQATVLTHTHSESKLNSFKDNDRDSMFNFFKRLRKLLIFQSTIQGKNWASLQTTKTVFIVISLVIFTRDSVGLTQGQIIAAYIYIVNFVNSLMSLPIAVENITRVTDVIKRLRTVEPNK